MISVPYNRPAVYEYASLWAYKRNPLYYSFDAIGGDCTNFVSQCIFAGAKVMNFSPMGWYYTSLSDRSPSWTGVEFLYDFLVRNSSYGPYGADAPLENIETGDVIQLSQNGDSFTHTLIVTRSSPASLLVAAHSQDAFNRPLSTYTYRALRAVHILGVRAN